MQLTLLVPDIVWPEPGDQFTLGKLQLPGLQWINAHGALQRTARIAHEDCLAALFGLEGTPHGALRLLGENAASPPGDGVWLCADPVHLRFHHERIVLADAGAFTLTSDEAMALVAALNHEFADIGTFHVVDPRRWYLRLAKPRRGRFPPLSAIAGRRLDSDLDSDADQDEAWLKRWLNEVQMFLHGHPVNAARQASGQPPVNSVWLWGLGPLPTPQPPSQAGLWADNPLAIGLARNRGLAHRRLPTTLNEVIAASPGQEAALVVIEELLGPVLYENGDDWRRAAEALDRDWLQPAIAQLGRKITCLTIVSPTVYGELRWTIRPGERWKFWKKGPAVAALARQLAEGTTP